MHLPDLPMPAAFQPLLPVLPPSPHSVMLAFALNRVLAPVAELERLQSLRGKTVCIRISEPSLAFWLSIEGRRFVPRRWTARPEVTIAATARDFWRMARREEDPDTLFFSRRLVMEGNTESGLLIKNVLDAVDPSSLPFVERLARLVSRLPGVWQD